MNEIQPSTAPSPPEPATFSLRALFLFVTSAGVASVALRVADNAAEGVALAMFLVGVFLTFWFLVTRRITAMDAAFTLFAIGLAFAVLLPAIMSGGGPRRRPACQNNLKWIGLALLEYHSSYGCFPPAFVADANGKPLYSWRVLILPFLDQASLRNAIRSDEAWNGPNNAKVTSNPVAALFHCPDDVRSAKPVPLSTSYVAVVGPHTAWAGATPRKVSDFKNPSHTILVIEIANSGIQWAEPRDLHIGQMPMAVNPKIGQGISSDHPGGVNAVFADGSVHFIPDTIDPKKLAELLDLDGCSDEAAIAGVSR